MRSIGFCWVPNVAAITMNVPNITPFILILFLFSVLFWSDFFRYARKSWRQTPLETTIYKSVTYSVQMTTHFIGVTSSLEVSCCRCIIKITHWEQCNNKSEKLGTHDATFHVRKKSFQLECLDGNITWMPCNEFFHDISCMPKFRRVCRSLSFITQV